MGKMFCQVKLSSNDSGNLKKLFKYYNLVSILSKCKITKMRGIPIFNMLNMMLLFILEKSNSIYQGIAKNKCFTMKTPINDMLNNPNYNWRNFLYSIAKIFTKHCYNKESDIGCLIIDDTSKTKSGRKVQWLSWFYDHSKDQYFTGFQNILCAYTNGRTAIPIDFEFKIGKSKVKHYTKSNYEEGTHAGQRVRFAKQKKIEIATQMIKRAFQRNFQFKYILWDSWYNSSKALEYISEVVTEKGVNLISMLKNGNTKYKYKKGFFNLKELFQKAGKWETDRKTGIKSKWVVVKYLDASKTQKKSDRKELITIKIAFYKYPNVKNWKAILSTDLELDPTEILHLYLRRWSIECIFRELKQYFGYNQSMSSNYISMVADFTIRCVFYIMFCHIREIENHKSMHQLLFEFYEELFDEWLDNYIKLRMQKEIEHVLNFAKELGMQSIDELILNLDNVMKRFFDEVFLPDKITEADKQAKRKIA